MDVVILIFFQDILSDLTNTIKINTLARILANIFNEELLNVL